MKKNLVLILSMMMMMCIPTGITSQIQYHDSITVNVFNNKMDHLLANKALSSEVSEYPWYFQTMQLDKAHEITKGKEEIVIALIDTGFDYNYTEFQDKLWLNPNEQLNGKDDSGNGLIDDIHGWNFHANNNILHDVNGHGTSSASLLVGMMTDDIIGVAPNVRIMPIKVGDISSTYENLAKGIKYAVRNGADVIYYPFTSYLHELIDEALDFVHEADIPFITSYTLSTGELADNFRLDPRTIVIGGVDHNFETPSALISGQGIDFATPATEIFASSLINQGLVGKLYINDNHMLTRALTNNILTPTPIVGEVIYAGLGFEDNYTSLDVTNKIVLVDRGEISFSNKSATAFNQGAVGIIIANNEPGLNQGNFGDGTSIPGVTISQENGINLKASLNSGVVTANITIEEGNVAFYSPFISAPAIFTSGIVSLMLSVNPFLTVAEIYSILKDTAIDVNDPGYDLITGYGIINAYEAIKAAASFGKPSISAADNELVIIDGEIGKFIKWTGTSVSPDKFIITRNAHIVSSGAWHSGSPVSYYVDNLPIGKHDFTITLNDTLGRSNNHTVEVYIISAFDATTPTTADPNTIATTDNDDEEENGGFFSFLGFLSFPFVPATLFIVLITLIITKTRKSNQ
jgi:hypothetical protein